MNEAIQAKSANIEKMEQDIGKLRAEIQTVNTQLARTPAFSTHDHKLAEL